MESFFCHPTYGQFSPEFVQKILFDRVEQENEHTLTPLSKINYPVNFENQVEHYTEKYGFTVRDAYLNILAKILAGSIDFDIIPSLLPKRTFLRRSTTSDDKGNNVDLLQLISDIGLTGKIILAKVENQQFIIKALKRSYAKLLAEGKEDTFEENTFWQEFEDLKELADIEDATGMKVAPRPLSASKWEKFFEEEFIMGENPCDPSVNKNLSYEDKREIAKQLVEYVSFLEKKGILLGELRGEHLIWQRENRRLRIVDFGFLDKKTDYTPENLTEFEKRQTDEISHLGLVVLRVFTGLPFEAEELWKKTEETKKYWLEKVQSDTQIVLPHAVELYKRATGLSSGYQNLEEFLGVIKSF